jgi:hypothetical protein
VSIRDLVDRMTEEPAEAWKGLSGLVEVEMPPEEKAPPPPAPSPEEQERQKAWEELNAYLAQGGEPCRS